MDRGARSAVLVPCGVAAAVAVLALPVFDSPLPFAVALTAYLLATAALNVVPSVVTGERWPARQSGAVVGLTRTVDDVGAAVGPLAVFWIADTWDAVVACALMAVVLAGSVVGLGAVLITRRAPQRVVVGRD